MDNITNDTYQELVNEYGTNDVFTTQDVREQFEVIAFSAPFVSVIKKETGEKGYLQFIHHPRFYFNFIAC